VYVTVVQNPLNNPLPSEYAPSEEFQLHNAQPEGLVLPEKILVADDELDIRHLSKIILEEEGYEVSLATNGVEAIEKVEGELPHLVFLDDVMPEMTGLEVCSILKSQEKTKHIPIVISSALSVAIGNGKSRMYADDAGANGYLAKPFNGNELLSEVKKYLPLPQQE
jgi:CheY-like chemotaxis protein